MGFLDGLKRFLGFSDDEDEKKKKQQQQAAANNQNRSSSSNAAPSQNQNRPNLVVSPQVSQRPDNGVNLVLPGQTGNTPTGFPTLLKKTQPVDTRSSGQQEIDELTAANLKKAKDDQHTSWLDRNVTDRNWQKSAEALARNRAVTQYQEKHGYNQQPEVMASLKKSKDQLEKHSQDIAKTSHVIDNIAKGADKAGSVAQYVPVTGTVLNLGLAGSERLAKATGNSGMERDISNQRYKNEFGMTKDEFDALPDDVRHKLMIVRGASYALSPLDFTGVTGLAKSGVVQGSKAAAKELITEGAVKLATKEALTEAAKAEAKKFAITTAIGTGVGVGSQAWIGGKDSIDPLAAFKGGVMAGGTSLLFNSNPEKAAAQAADEIAPGVRSVNPQQAEHAIEQSVDNTPAYQRGIPTTVGEAQGQQNLMGRTNLPDSMFSADASGRSSAVPNDPLDIPTFMRKNAPAKAADAKQVMAMLDERAGMIRQNQGQVSKFNDKQAIAEAFRESPKKGNAVAAYIKNRNQRVDPEAELQKTAAARATAAKELTAAENARAAQEQLDNAPKAEDFHPHKMNEKEAAALKNLDKAAKERVLTTDEKALRDTLREKTQVIDNANNPKPVKAEAPAVASPTPAQTLQPASTIPAAFPEVPKKVVSTAQSQTVNATGAAPAVKAAKTAKTPAKQSIVGTSPDATAPLEKAPLSGGTGEIKKSKGKYARGQEYEAKSGDLGRQAGVEAASKESYDTFVKKMAGTTSTSDLDRDTALALQARQPRGSAEHKALGNIANRHNLEAAQTLGTTERVIRRTADADALSNRFVNKLYASTDDSIEMKPSDFAGIEARNQEFTTARDNQNTAIEAFNNDPSDANTKAVTDAFKKADAADRAAKFEEYKVASAFNKKNSNPKGNKLVAKLEADAGVYTMDWVDSSMLSSTRVMINNFINTIGVRNEEAMFGKVGAKLARQFTKTDIGGGSREGAKLGVRLGMDNWKADMSLRQQANGNKLTKSIKNFVTSGNTLGDRNTYAAAYSGVYDHYKFKLKNEGFTGPELERRSLVNSMTDPDNVSADYMNQALANNAMSSTTKGTRTKMETQIAGMISEKLGNSTAAKVAGKAITRVTLGFPTVIGRSLVAGGKRALLGTPEASRAVINAIKKGDPAETAALIKQAVKEGGSGATMYAMGAALGFSGVITGGYPSDQEERDRWKREGISENSIKIGKDYYSLPAALGVFSLPFMIGANGGNNVREGKGITDDLIPTTVSTVINSMPIDSLDKTVKFLTDAEQGRDVSDYIAGTGSSIIRSVSPLGSLTNQFAKMFDPNANETSTGDTLTKFINKVADGIPGVANNLQDKEVDGNLVKNPNPVAKFLGATSTEQGAGVQKTEDIKGKVTSQTQRLADNGFFDDKFRNRLDDDTKLIYDKALKGKNLSEAEVKKLNAAATDGVSETEDSRFLEDGDYDGNLSQLKMKRALLEDDPTTRRETMAAYDQQIKRGEIYKQNKTPYALTKNYKEYSLEEWRDLGDPESDTYNEKLYKELFALDEQMTNEGVSRKSGDATQPKYYAKKPGKGGSGGGGSGNSTVKGNTIGDTPTLGKFSFGDLAPEKLPSAKIVKLQQIRSSDLVKKRNISIRKA